ncbi:MAG: hypothetical protein Q9166_001525 [cf. Caloplaca sp. 2 TL-2023]
MSTGRKVALTGVFMVALVGLGASIARMAVFIQLATALNTQAVWFSMLETGLALISLNLPPTWGLFSHLSLESVLNSLRSLFSTQSRGSSRGSSGSFEKTKGRAYVNMHHKGYNDVESQDVELVPHRAVAEFDTKVEGQSGVGSKQKGGDWRGGISVHSSMEQTESRIV